MLVCPGEPSCNNRGFLKFNVVIYLFNVIQAMTVQRLTALVNQTVIIEDFVMATLIPQDAPTVILDIWDQPVMMNVFMESLMPTIPCVFVHRPAITVLVAI